jgi:hypothetical protein
MPKTAVRFARFFRPVSEDAKTGDIYLWGSPTVRRISTTYTPRIYTRIDFSFTQQKGLLSDCLSTCKGKWNINVINRYEIAHNTKKRYGYNHQAAQNKAKIIG